MPSVNTLKYSISLNGSVCAALTIFALYSLVMFLLLLACGFSWLTFPILLLLLSIAIYGTSKAYQYNGILKLSDSGRVELTAKGKLVNGVIGARSFYNSLFISLDIAATNARTHPLIIYRDAVTEAEYRLLARVINFGRS